MMVKKGVSAKKGEKRKQVLYGISMDSHSAESLHCDLVKVAKLACQLVSIQVCSNNSELGLKEKKSIKCHSESCKCFPCIKQVCFTGPFSRGNSIKKVIKKVAKNCSAMAVIIGTNPENSIGGLITSNYSMQGNDSFWKAFGYQPGGFKLESWPRFYPINKISKEDDGESRYDSKGLKDGDFSLHHDYEEKAPLSSISLLLKQLPESNLGWPLLRKTASMNEETLTKSEKSDMFVVPNQSVKGILQNRIEFGPSRITEDSFEREIENSMLDEQGAERTSSQVIQTLEDELSTVSTLGWPLRRNVSGEALRKLEARDMPHQSTRTILKNQIETEYSLEREKDNLMINEMGIERASSHVIRTFEDGSVNGSKSPNDESLGLVCEYDQGFLSSSTSFSIEELPQSVLGWPLLRIAASTILKAPRESEPSETSVVQWAMTLPNRSKEENLQTQIGFGSNTIENPVERELNNNNNCLLESGKQRKELELLLKTKSSGCRWFSYEELKIATSQFSSENLIGEGGCSSVYKGCLPSGKSVAVKILKSYKEAWNDFSLEIDIVSSLNHKHITPLIGVCIQDKYLISVYDFLAKGSLEESLHGNKEKSVLPWGMRFNVAVVVAEALNYLHNECSRPVIHRDVKSSNILLSAEFQPQLSDFGLAIWGPIDSTYMIHGYVVGTFGYIAPEYFMHGRASDKIDVYSFGVVLLELLSGKMPIGSETLKGQESLVKWAKPLIDSGDLNALLDPNLDGDYDIVQMHRMILAASLCINQSTRLRPKVIQILKLLKGEKDAEEWVKSHVDDLQEDEELYPQFDSKPHLELASALLDADNETTTSPSSAKPKRHFSLEDYFKGRHGLSSSHFV